MEPVAAPVEFIAAPNIPVGTVLSVVITLIFIWWAAFSLVAAYHWFRFGRDSWVAVPALVIHFIVSAWIFMFATGGLPH